MKRLVLLAVIVLSLSAFGVAPNAPYGGGVPAYAQSCATPDGKIDWSGSDSDYLSANQGVIYTWGLPCKTRIIVRLSVPSGANFPLFLVEDTSAPREKLDENDKLLTWSNNGTGKAQAIDYRVPDTNLYFIVVIAVDRKSVV